MLRLKRDFSVEQAEVSDGVFEIAFSSEAPVQREILDEYNQPKLVNEILVHDGAHNADLERINNGAALLFNHDFDKHLGKVIPGSVRIDPDRIGRAKVQFSKHGELAQEVSAKVAEGTITKISFGYDLLEYEVQDNNLMVTKWAPYEVSFVTVPADDSVGLGRSLNINVNKTNLKEQKMAKRVDEMSIDELKDMTVEEIESLSEEDAETRELAIQKDADAAEVAGEAEVAKPDPISDAPSKDSQPKLSPEQRLEEVKEIEEIAERYKISRDEVLNAYASNMTASQFKRSIKPNKSPVVIRKMQKDTQTNLESKFSLDKVIRAMASNKALTGVEAEYGQEMARARAGTGMRSETSVYIPASALRSGQTVANTKDIMQTDVRYDSFVNLLLEKSILGKVNANVLTGLTTPTDVPRQTKSGIDAFDFVDENDVSPEAEMAFDNVKLMPKSFTGGIKMSRSVMNTMPNIGEYISGEIVKRSRIKLEKMILGSLMNKNGRAGLVKMLEDMKRVKTGEMTYKAFLAVVAELTDSGVEAEEIKFLMSGVTAAELKSTLRDPAVHDFIISDNNTLGGTHVLSSGIVESGSVLAGDFSGLTIGEWKGLELDLDTTSQRNSGAMIARIWCDMDWDVSNPDKMMVLKAGTAGGTPAKKAA
ncbi:major capsid protein [Serratia marcescens]|uniref:phage major capsid family protein n=1 Tax=Serratia marcescens TaxID=615 RepID=UPI00106829C6|nr:phage major capsid protein [Serratia marcescens]TEW83372.1 major capsid protein [Serratia marcescens]